LFRGEHFCNRYCYLEVDGYYYCQRRLHPAGSQAPPPVVVARPPRRYAPPGAPYLPPRRRVPRSADGRHGPQH
jgi:hypothetical protein